jgi:glucose 1-dehydrogenase
VSVKALSVVPGKPDTAGVRDHPDPSPSEGGLLVEGLLMGVCGTDIEIVQEGYGWSPPGEERLIIGHESLGRVVDAPSGSGFASGDLVAGIVRRPDPVPCEPCGKGQWDFCRNGKYTERGIKERNGFGSETWRIEPQYSVRLEPALRGVGVLMEPTSVVSKAWDHVVKIGERAAWKPKTALITGAGPIGLLAAMIGVQRGLEVHVLDRVEHGLKPKLVEDLGAHYHTGPVRKIGICPDVTIECTGAASLIVETINQMGNDGILCLAGVSSHNQDVSLDIGTINRTMVLENQVIFGSVNANRHHWQMAHDYLLKADRNWLSRLISRKEPLANWKSALQRQPDDIKVVLQFGSQ